MKKLLLLIMVLLLIPGVFAQNATITSEAPIENTIYLFYGEECPHCHEEMEFLKTIETEFPDLNIMKYEVWHNEENNALFMQMVEDKKVSSLGVPALFVGEELIIGYSSEETTGQEIRSAILKLMGEEGFEVEQTINIPFIGKVNISNMSLPALTVILGVIDGFNPCAMWVLMFLIALLINTHDRKKMWIIGGTFIFISALMYYFFMAAWLNAFMFIGYLKITQIIIGIIAVGAGGYYFYDYLTFKPGECKVTSSKTKMKIMTRMRNLVEPALVPATIIGIILLAFTVNLIELLCSFGLPAVYTRTLTLNNLSPLSYYGYMAVYILFYMIDDIIVFGIAIKTLKMVDWTGKYSQYLRLIGALLMLFLGLAMMFKPDMLMFGV